MPRRPRNAPGDYVYHVLNRANERARLFSDPSDYMAFRSTLAEALKRVPIRLLAFCLMPNHWHMVLWPRTDDELPMFMAWMTGTHAVRWRMGRDTVGNGHVYQDRYKAFPVESNAHFLTVCRYVERNPLRAGLVQRAEDWPWSSILSHRTRRLGDSISLCEWPIPTPDDWLRLVNTPQTRNEIAALRLSIRKNRPFGSESWQKEVSVRLGIDLSVHPRGRPQKPRAD